MIITHQKAFRDARDYGLMEPEIKESDYVKGLQYAEYYNTTKHTTIADSVTVGNNCGGRLLRLSYRYDPTTRLSVDKGFYCTKCKTQTGFNLEWLFKDGTVSIQPENEHDMEQLMRIIVQMKRDQREDERNPLWDKDGNLIAHQSRRRGSSSIDPRVPYKYRNNPDDYAARQEAGDKMFNSKGRSRTSYRYRKYRL